MTLHWHTERRKVSELKDYPKNPRTFTEKGMADLKASLLSLGYIDPIAINLDGTIIGGHARKQTLIALGLHEVDVRVPDRQLTAKEVSEAIIRLNRNTAGTWDFKVLEDSFSRTDLVDWGFEKHEFNVFSPSKGNTDPDEEVITPSVAVTVLGDQWVLGNHTIRCGDSTSSDDVALLMGGRLADMVFTDPPYGVAYRDTGSGAWNEAKLAKKKAGTLKPRFAAIENDDLNEEDLFHFLVAYMRVQPLKKKAAQYVCHASLRAHCFREALLETGYAPRAELIWAKSRPGFNFAHYKHKHEPIYYATPIKGSPEWYGDQKQTTLWEVASESGAIYEHPTQKPVGLPLIAIGNSSLVGDVVYEPFSGSGTTLMACEQSSRACYAMELNPLYVDVAVMRWQRFTGKQAVHAVTGQPFPHVNDKPVVDTKKKPAKAKG